MDIFEAIEGRHSIRQFQAGAAVDEETVKKILQAATMAPSAANCQCWRFIVVREQELRHKLALDVGHQLFLEKAPVVVVVCADLAIAEKKFGERGRHTYALQETAAAVQNMMLAAHALGLGSCWVGSFDEERMSSLLGLSPDLRPVAMVPIGVSAEPATRPHARKGVDEVTDYR